MGPGTRQEDLALVHDVGSEARVLCQEAYLV